MKKLAFLGGATGLGLLALLGAPHTQAADHADAAMTAANPMADIADVYAWMTNSGANIALAMTVSPFDNGTREFGPSVQYVFHLTRYEDFPVVPADIAAGEQSKVICTFESNTSGECWVVDPSNKVLDYVKGDFSAATGKASAGGKLRVFAGRRSDPFFFNLAGFATAKQHLMLACGDGMTPGACPGGGLVPALDAAGCPTNVPAATVEAIAAELSAQQDGTGGSVLPPGCSATEKDCFKDKNVMAIVVEIDKTLVATEDKPLLSVYGSTHAGQ